MSRTREVKIDKARFLAVLNAVLETTGCREICRRCNEDGEKPIILDGVDYSDPNWGRGGCCRRCDFLTDTGCRGSGSGRSISCTLWVCRRVEWRLRDFGLGRWWQRMKRFYEESRKINNPEAYDWESDLRRPYKFPLDWPVTLNPRK